jgi:hypothetical protein
MKMRSAIIVSVFIVAFSVSMVLYFLFHDETVVLTRSSDPETGQALILGISQDRLEEWTFFLYWRKGQGPWARYLLDRQVSFWESVEFSKAGNVVTLKRRNQVIGQLDSADGSFSNLIRRTVQRTPTAIVNLSDSLKHDHQIYPESSEWLSAWARVINKTNETLMK